MAQPACNARTIINSRPPDYTWLRQPSAASATAATPRVNLKSVTWLNNRNQAGWKSLTTWPYYTNRFCARLHTFTRGSTYTHQRDSRALLVVYIGAVSAGRRWMTRRGAYRRKSVIPTRVRGIWDGSWGEPFSLSFSDPIRPVIYPTTVSNGGIAFFV